MLDCGRIFTFFLSNKWNSAVQIKLRRVLYKEMKIKQFNFFSRRISTDEVWLQGLITAGHSYNFIFFYLKSEKTQLKQTVKSLVRKDENRTVFIFYVYKHGWGLVIVFNGRRILFFYVKCEKFVNESISMCRKRIKISYLKYFFGFFTKKCCCQKFKLRKAEQCFVR